MHLAGGESLEVRYVLMLGQDWVALAVSDDEPGHVRTELVPYESIYRVTIRPSGPDGSHIGFEQRVTTILGQNGATRSRAEGVQPARPGG